MNQSDDTDDPADKDVDVLRPFSLPSCPPLPRSQYVVESESTRLQQATEDECMPFFVDLRELPIDQVRHLRRVGLIPPQQPKPDDLGLPGRDGNLLPDDVPNSNYDEGPQILVLDESVDQPTFSERDDESFQIRLLRDKHREYLTRALTKPLHPNYVSLDASRPWIIYWTLHSLDLLDELPEEAVLVNVVKALDDCWEEIEVELDGDEIRNDSVLGDQLKGSADMVRIPGGGFGGNVGQMAHCAPTYAAVLALAIVHGAGAERSAPSSFMAIDVIRSKRRKLYAWFQSLRCNMPLLGGHRHQDMMTAYRMHHDGEVDVRATYTMLAVAKLLQIDTPILASAQAADFVASCQTYEGGFGGEPDSEAHGGYTFCAIAALKLLEGRESSRSGSRKVTVDFNSLRAWLARRQMGSEGGFAGRCNKLVDGCYSFWQGSAMAVLDTWNGQGSDLCFDRSRLERYILLCAQDVNGGLRDKPSKPRDFYHSCYNLSGLSLAQHSCKSFSHDTEPIYGDATTNLIGETDPVLNIRVKTVEVMLAADLN